MASTLFAVALAFGASAAHAAVYSVGADGACTHTSIASALAAAEARPGADTIHIASNRTYTQQTIAISTAQPLDLVGGFADCSQAAGDGSHAIIDGNDLQPVFRITADTGGVVRLTGLTIELGKSVGGGKGGGIYFKGNGSLELNHVTVTQNIADYGGGLYAEGTGSDTRLVIGTDVAIVGNIARVDGGGVVNDGTTMTMIAPDSYIANNQAQGLEGIGGGLLILGHDRDAHTSLGSSGIGNLGAIYLNRAVSGGGIAVDATNNRAELDLFSTDPARPMRIKGNTATAFGGGILLGSTSGDFPSASLRVWYAWFEDNVAAHGAAIDVFTPLGVVTFNDPAQRPSGSIDCPVGKPCGGVIANVGEDESAQPSGGIVEVTTGATARFQRMEFRGNSAESVFSSSGDSNVGLAARSVAFTGNTTSRSLISTIGDSGLDGFVDIENTTIAGNTIGNNRVLQVSNASGANKLYRSIIWQPGMITLQNDGPQLDLLDDMVSERSSLDGGSTSTVIEQDPRFVDPGHGDYSLRAGSPAVDFAASVANDARDLDSNPRDVDLPVVVNVHGKRDLGAIERQTLQPFMLNADFDADLRLWSDAMAGIATWDATRNASGATGSGSAHLMSANAGAGVAGLVQCVHLPGPGSYALNGFGHGTGTMFTVGDIAELHWEFRRFGGEECTTGAPDATGTHVLSISNSWNRPATPAIIEVSDQDWTYTSSIAVTLVAAENGASGPPTNAWFDGITLGVEGDDTIFANGFEN